MNPIDQYIKLIEKHSIEPNHDLILDKALLIGSISQLILQKKIYKRNNDISDLIKEVFETEFLDYVMKSRTLLVSRIIRIIDSSDEQEFYKILNKFNEYVQFDNNDDDSEDFIDYWGKIINDSK
ncbi:hypothetical protein [Aeribacillus pallidus]|jgi:hypothetical protein|uniref:hypothetical protein n=1 Tax=Aeribacillus pallidus TaxID=33936 RepID=UPI000E341A10|nr:hypothetical protein [Aeribacillus pallidus]